MLFEQYNTTLQFLEQEYPGFIDYVPAVFLDDPPVPKILSFTVAFIFLVLLIMSVVGNSLMVFAYIKYQDVRSSSNKLVVNLAISDMIMHIKSWVLIVNGFNGGPILGGLGCKLFAGFGTGSGLSAIWTITAISFERCKAISSPLSSSRAFTNKKVNFVILTIWLLAGFFSALPLMGIGKYISEKYLLSCSAFDPWSTDRKNIGYIILMISVAWFIPLVTITGCYLKIYSYTRGTKKLIRNATASDYYEGSVSNIDAKGDKKLSPKEQQEKKTERQVALKLLVIIFVWLAAWTPFATILMIQMAGYDYIVHNNVALFAMIICKVTSVINSFLYGLRLPKFRKRIAPLVAGIPILSLVAKMDSAADANRLKTAFTVETNVRSGGAAPAGEDIIMPAAAGVVSGDANSGAIFREQSATRIKENAKAKKADKNGSEVQIKVDCHQNRLYFYKHLCSLTVNWDGKEKRRRVSI